MEKRLFIDTKIEAFDAAHKEFDYVASKFFKTEKYSRDDIIQARR